MQAMLRRDMCWKRMVAHLQQQSTCDPTPSSPGSNGEPKDLHKITAALTPSLPVRLRVKDYVSRRRGEARELGSDAAPVPVRASFG
mmetsp:Transcript_26695/g.36699  ORF Transcript_26695/g.36699 Transcript_26695/m.36699 type:complete len:86 (+) Transcript_26695:436-693(+)